MATVDIEIRPGMRVGIRSDGPSIVLVVYEEGSLVGPINLTRTQAIQAANDISETGISGKIATYFDPAERVAIAAAIQYFLANEA